MEEENVAPTTPARVGEVGPAEHTASRDSASWKADGHALEISYSIAAMDEMCHAAWEGLQKIPRRGLEVGGLLFGMRRGDLLEITSWRPIACEHAKGPGFELSAKDEAELKQQLEAAGDDPALKLLEPLGWFHSHTREKVELSRTDLDLHNRFFPAPYQVALVLRPHAYEPTRAGFFFREGDGSIRTEASYHDFVPETKRRKAIGFDAAELAGRGRLQRLPTHLLSAQGGPQPVASGAEETQPAVRPSRFWRWAGVILTPLVILAAAILLGLPLLRPTPLRQSVSLAASAAGGQLSLDWDRGAEPVLKARSATLVIKDGTLSQQMILTPEELRTGVLAYQHQTGDVEFRLEVNQPGKPPVTETARFLGPAPAVPEVKPRAPSPDAAQATVIRAEIQQLRKQLAAEAARGRKLRQQVAVIEQRLGSASAGGRR